MLGETFRSIWDIRPAHLVDGEPECFDHLDPDAGVTASDGESIKSGASSVRSRPTSVRSSSEITEVRHKTSKLALTDAGSERSGGTASGSTAPTSVATEDGALPRPSGTARVSFLNEQVSHHPPISGFWVECQPADDEHQTVQAYGASLRPA